MVVVFFAVFLYSGAVAFADLQTQNSTDAGIITQAVASAAHGHATPFYESYDCMVKSRCSFLLVHPAFVLYVAVPFYDIAPNTVTLFALRSVVVATAALPLYWLTRQVTRSPGKGLLAAGMFLVFAPVFAGDAFSLHVESLLPLELFTLAALWQAGRYRLGLGVAVIMFFTFEVFPLFTFLLGAFFLVPYVTRWLRRGWRNRAARPGRRVSLTSALSFGFRGVREAGRVREIRYLMVLMGASVVAYIVLALFLNAWGSEILGVAAPKIAPGLGGLFSNNSSPATQPLGTVLRSPQTVATAEYWLILYALVAFIPLLIPRALLLSVPWIVWTFLTDSSRFSTIGHQYSMIAAGPLFIGLAYGLELVPIGRPSNAVNRSAVGAASAPSARNQGAAAWHSRLPPRRAACIGIIGIVVVSNLLLIPINPALPSLGVNLGAPFASGYFDHSLEITPQFGWEEKLVSTVPNGATIAAPSILFPLIANLPHAYVVVPPPFRENFTHLPFDLGDGPQYVLVDISTFPMMGAELERSLSNPLEYGMSAYVPAAPKGPLLLYERNYSLPTEVFGSGIPPERATALPGNGLTPGDRGVEETNASSPSGLEIQSVDTGKRTGLVWSGPGDFLSPGNYSIKVQLLVTGENLTSNPTAQVIRIDIAGLSGDSVNETLHASTFTPGRWQILTFNLSLAEPVPELNVGGYLVSNQFSVAVASVAVGPQPP